MFTERVLYVRINDEGHVELVNTLDLEGATDENILSLLDSGTTLSKQSCIYIHVIFISDFAKKNPNCLFAELVTLRDILLLFLNVMEVFLGLMRM